MIGYHPVARIVTAILAAVCFAGPLIPAVKINLDAAASQGEAWTYFAIGSVAFAALCVDTAIAHKGVALRMLAAILAAGFLCLNVSTPWATPQRIASMGARIEPRKSTSMR